MFTSYYLLVFLAFGWVVNGIPRYIIANSLYPKNIASEQRREYFKNSIIFGAVCSGAIIIGNGCLVWLLKTTPEIQQLVSSLGNIRDYFPPVWLVWIAVGGLGGYLLGKL